MGTGRINSPYSIAQMCTREDTLAHNLGPPYVMALTTSIYQIFLGVDIDRSCVEQGQKVGHRLYAVVGDDHADLGIKLEINNTGLILVTKTGHGGLSLVEIDEWLKVSRHELVPIV